MNFSIIELKSTLVTILRFNS